MHISYRKKESKRERKRVGEAFEKGKKFSF